MLRDRNRQATGLAEGWVKPSGAKAAVRSPLDEPIGSVTCIGSNPAGGQASGTDQLRTSNGPL